MKLSGAPGLAGLAAILSALSGCSPTGEGLAVEAQGSRKVSVAWAEARQDGQETVVRGRLLRREASSYPLRGHVDAKLLDKDGNVLTEACSGELGVYRSAPGKGLKLTPFEVRVPAAPPDGGRVVVAYHQDAHASE